MRTMKIALTAAAVLALGFTAACNKKPADSAAASDATPAASTADSAASSAMSAASTADSSASAASSAASTADSAAKK